LDFVGKRRYFFLVSLAVLLPGIVYLIMAPGLNTGIDFTGGSSLTLDFAADVTQEDLRAELAELGHGEATVQEQRDIEAEGDINFFIRIKQLEEEGKNELVEGLKTALSPDGLEILSFDLVSPVVAGRSGACPVRSGMV
jgi:preprotein translocase subunit SecF